MHSCVGHIENVHMGLDEGRIMIDRITALLNLSVSEDFPILFSYLLQLF